MFKALYGNKKIYSKLFFNKDPENPVPVYYDEILILEK